MAKAKKSKVAETFRGPERTVRLVRVTEGRNRGRVCVIGDRKPGEKVASAFRGAKATKVAAGCPSSIAEAREIGKALARVDRIPKGKGKLRAAINRLRRA